MAAPRVGEQLVVQDPLEGPEQDSGQVAQSWGTKQIENVHKVEDGRKN